MQAQSCFIYQPDLPPFPPLAFLPAGGVGGAGFFSACGEGGGGGGLDVVGAIGGSVFGQRRSLGDELADQGLGHGTSPAT